MNWRSGIAVLLGLSVNSCLPFLPANAPEECHWGYLTDQGGACQTMTARDGEIYSFFWDMNGYSLGERVCICGTAALMTTCKTGQPLDLVHLDRECPGPPDAYP